MIAQVDVNQSTILHVWAWTRRILFQKRVVRTNLDIYVNY